MDHIMDRELRPINYIHRSLYREDVRETLSGNILRNHQQELIHFLTRFPNDI